MIVPAAPPRVPPPDRDRAGQIRVRILEMIVRAEPVANVLDAIVDEMASCSNPGGAAILVLRGERLEPAAARGFTAGQFDALRELSLAALVDTPDCLLRALISRAGELLGAVAVSGAQCSPLELEIPEEFQALETLAAFAIEHDNLLSGLTWRAEHDPLTELCNRQWFERRLAAAALESRAQESGFAVLSLNIDRFSLINDVLGYRVGNRLLREIAARLQANIGRHDCIARAGGNEFLFLIAGAGTIAEASAAAEKLLACLGQPFLIEDHELFVSASIGVTLVAGVESGNKEPESRAWAAMTCAKIRGRNQVAFFDLSMLQHSREQLEIGCRLRNALAHGEMELHYQPQIDLSTGETIGAEALLRWKHAAIGFVSPATFIPVAEASGLIAEFGEWAIAEALRQGAAWNRDGLRPLRIAVNISPVHFLRADFADRLRSLLPAAGTHSFALELEITETAVMQDLDYACNVMRDLGKAGIGFAIDDFGTGHSSLAWLHKLPVHRLKIPQNFVHEISSSGVRPTLLSNIIRLTREMRLACIAEGVETDEQALALAAMGCGEAQGFLYSKPVNPAEFARWLRERPF